MPYLQPLLRSSSRVERWGGQGGLVAELLGRGQTHMLSGRWVGEGVVCACVCGPLLFSFYPSHFRTHITVPCWGLGPAPRNTQASTNTWTCTQASRHTHTLSLSLIHTQSISYTLYIHVTHVTNLSSNSPQINKRKNHDGYESLHSSKKRRNKYELVEWCYIFSTFTHSCWRHTSWCVSPEYRLSARRGN